MKNILFDIDSTLLNTSQMVRNLHAMIAQEADLSKETVEKYHIAYVEKLPHITHFDFVVLINTLPVNDKVKNNIIDRYHNNSEIFTKYEDVDEVLEALHGKYKIGIFSEGTPHFQENKLKNLKISNFLDSNLVFISQSKRSNEYIDSIPPSIIVDDNVDVCNILASHKRHQVIHLNRKYKEFTPETNTLVDNSVTSINSLKELIDVL